MLSPLLVGALFFAAMSTSNTVVWEEKQPMPRAEAGGAAGFVGGELIVAGGTAWDGDVKLWLRDTQIYHPSQDQWRSGPPLPVPLAYGPFVQSDRGLEILGGTDGKLVYRESWKLDAGKAKWEQTSVAPADVLLGGAARLGDDTFLLGGCPDIADLTHCSDAVWRRGKDGEWRRVSTLPSGPLALAAIAGLGSHIYLFGGCSMPSAGNVVNHSRAYRYDSRKNSWTKLRDLPAANRGLSAVATDERRIYLLGGYGSSFSADVLVYDTQADTYQHAAPLPAPLMAIPFARDGRRLYGAGGEDRPRGRSARMVVGELSK
jgi:hypothetical protein